MPHGLLDWKDDAKYRSYRFGRRLPARRYELRHDQRHAVQAAASSATEMTFVVPADAAPGPVVLIFGNQNSYVMNPGPFLVLRRK